MIILSIETSCDDTCVAILDIKKSQIKVLSDFVSSQTQIHAPFGGVVPNLAVRAHYKNLPILLEEVFKKTDPKKIDLIAATVGPGLEPCLWAGVRQARLLALGMGKPIVGVNHLEGHIAANFVGGNPKHARQRRVRLWRKIRNPKKVLSSQFPACHACGKALTGRQVPNLFPAICLIVSGGHTQLVWIKAIGQYKIIGQTRDDAAGEAFDKVAKLLDLGYPGGPQIALKAQNGHSDTFKLPRPMIDASNYDFSFSGLKTAVLYLLTPPAPPLSKGGRRGRGVYFQNEQSVNDLCASFQKAVIDVLIAKTIKAAKEYKAKTVMLSGGVAANKELRKQMSVAIRNKLPLTRFLVPDTRFCTDNAAMIGLAGYWKYKQRGGDKIEKIVAKANLNL